MRQELEERVADWNQASEEDSSVDVSEAAEAWEKYEAVTRTLSHDLCEQLRLILEPTQVAKLKLVKFLLSPHYLFLLSPLYLFYC